MAVEYWFKWNGKSSEDYGIIVTAQPPITRGKERVATFTVPGKSGQLTQKEGDLVLDPIEMPVKCVVPDGSGLSDIYAWFSGVGRIEFANRPGGYYKGYLSKTAEAKRIVKGDPHREFTLAFTCDPFWYPNEVETIELYVSGQEIVNPGNAESYPIITVYGTDDIELTLNGTVELEAIEEGIILDWQLGDAMSLDKGVLLNEKVTGGPQTIPVGSSLVSWSGEVTKVVIEPHWRYS